MFIYFRKYYKLVLVGKFISKYMCLVNGHIYIHTFMDKNYLKLISDTAILYVYAVASCNRYVRMNILCNMLIKTRMYLKISLHLKTIHYEQRERSNYNAFRISKQTPFHLTSAVVRNSGIQEYSEVQSLAMHCSRKENPHRRCEINGITWRRVEGNEGC